MSESDFFIRLDLEVQLICFLHHPFRGHRPIRKKHSSKVYVHQNENNRLRSLSFCLQRSIRIIIPTNSKSGLQKMPKAFLTLESRPTTYSYLDFSLKPAVFGCLTNAIAPPPIVLESCSRAQTNRPV